MTGYVYRGAKPDGLGLDLETVNAEIMAARRERGEHTRIDLFSWGRHARSADLAGHGSPGHKNRKPEATT